MDTWAPLVFAFSVTLSVIGLGVLGLYALGRTGQGAVSGRFDRLVRARDLGNERPRAEVPGWVAFWMRWSDRSPERSGEARELALLLARAGFRTRSAVAAFVGVRSLACGGAIAATLIGSVVVSGSAPGSSALVATFVAGALGYLVPGAAVRARAAARERQIRDDVSLFSELLRLLFDAGLSLEQSLRVLAREGQGVFSALSLELDAVIRQIGAGQDRGRALQDMADELAIPEVSDLVRMIGQIDRYGGSVRGPLQEFSELIEDRRRTELQERVSKLSAKMTIVMILCLFPALLIFIAGPGLTALIRALERANG